MFFKITDGSLNNYFEIDTDACRLKSDMPNNIFTNNVGIGTTTPGYKLDVNGNTKLNGQVGIGTNPS